MENRKPTYTVQIFTPQELNHSSYIQTGLFELQQQGVIEVKVVLSVKKNKGRLTVGGQKDITETAHAFPKASFYTLIDNITQQKITFATDLYDHAEHFSKTALDTCDYYFKRNFESRFVKPIQKETHATICKLGITFGTHSEFKQGAFKLYVGLFLTNLQLAVKWDRAFLKRIFKTYKRQKRHWQFINTSRRITRFEAYETPNEKTILFQTRCFLHENDIDVQQIHQQRYRIIKLLRIQFPNHFLGGFVPSKIALEKYDDALTNVPIEPEAYLNAMKKAKIVIYTRGLANSPAWKMAEYLSQGKVIIAEPLTAELPVPLIEGKELLYFQNDAELIEKIKTVIDDEVLATRLSKNARAYFEKHIHPVQNTKRILEHMLQKPLS